MLKFAAILPVSATFVDIRQFLPFVTQYVKYGQTWPNMARNGLIYKVVNHEIDQLDEISDSCFKKIANYLTGIIIVLINSSNRCFKEFGNNQGNISTSGLFYR